MSAIETAKEFVRLGSTAGLSKDVIDLLQTKAALLAEQVTALEQENTALLRENRQLKLENENLKGQLQNARPKSEALDDICNQMLLRVANSRNITNNELIQAFGLGKAKGDFLLDKLWKRNFIRSPGAIARGSLLMVTTDGREYLANIGLI